MKWLGVIVFCLGLPGAQMKHLLRELGAALIVLFALLVLGVMPALGQNQVQLEPFGMLLGLPEFGVTLSGTPDNPVLENHSSQTIIGHVLRVFYANSAIPMNASDFKARDIWLNRGNGLQPNQSETPLTKLLRGKLRVNSISLANPTRVLLDSVVFANGQVVGPDVIGNFDRLSKHLGTLRELAALVQEARKNPSLESALWSEVERVIAQKGAALPLALDLRQAHNSQDDMDELEIANRVAALPTLWRTK